MQQHPVGRGDGRRAQRGGLRPVGQQRAVRQAGRRAGPRWCRRCRPSSAMSSGSPPASTPGPRPDRSAPGWSGGADDRGTRRGSAADRGIVTLREPTTTAGRQSPNTMSSSRADGHGAVRHGDRAGPQRPEDRDAERGSTGQPHHHPVAGAGTRPPAGGRPRCRQRRRASPRTDVFPLLTSMIAGWSGVRDAADGDEVGDPCGTAVREGRGRAVHGAPGVVCCGVRRSGASESFTDVRRRGVCRPAVCDTPTRPIRDVDRA